MARGCVGCVAPVAVAAMVAVAVRAHAQLSQQAKQVGSCGVRRCGKWGVSCSKWREGGCTCAFGVGVARDLHCSYVVSYW